jgi:hypothetical protein
LLERISAGSIEGYELFLQIEPDEFAYPEDDEGLTPKQLEAYSKDEWIYIVATVTAEKYGIVFGQASYGMLEYGVFPATDEQDNLIETSLITARDINSYVGTELAGEAISRAEEVIKKIREEN